MTNNRDYQNTPFVRHIHIYDSKGVVIGDDNTIKINEQQHDRVEALASLPSDIGDFVGRESQQTVFTQWLMQVNDLERTAPVVIGISGMAGVGKSRLAIHVLHRLKGLFPDGQVYLNLRGADQQPMSATQALLEVLRDGFGLEEKEISLEQRGRELQYRSLMAKRRVVVMLDNALDEEQVTPLRPPGGTSAVVVTSRERLELDGESLHLNPMEIGTGSELGESEALLHEIVRRVSPTRVLDDVDAARQIVGLCGRLPLGIRIAAATLKMPLWERKTLLAYRDELADEATRLAKLENERVEKAHPGQGRVRASFNLSYRALRTDLQRLFRYMSGLPGQDFGLALAATAIEGQEPEIKAGLNCLIEAQVLESSNGRYQFHDLMRLFAREKLEPTEQATVLESALSWYCNAAEAWKDSLNPLICRQRAKVVAAEKGGSAEELEQSWPQIAMNFFDSERWNWTAVLEQLAHLEHLDRTVTLATNLCPFFNRRSYWTDWISTQKIAKICAEKAGSQAGVADSLNNLGQAYHIQGRWDKAIAVHEQSLQIARELGDRHTEDIALGGLGNAFFSQARWNEAIAVYEQSLEISRDLGHELSAAKILMNMGNVYCSQARWNEAIVVIEQSLQISREWGDHLGVANNLGNLGLIYIDQGRSDEAIAIQKQALQIKQKLGDRRSAAHTLGNLGNAYSFQGQWEKAISAYEQSIQIARELDDSLGIAQPLCNLSNVYREQGRWEDAISVLEQALQISRELGHHSGVALILHNLGILYAKQECWDDAVSIIEQSSQILRELGDDRGVALSLTALGNLYRDQGQSDNAISIYRESLIILRELGDHVNIAMTLCNLSQTYDSQEQLDKMAQTLSDLGNSYCKQGKLNEAMAAYEQSSQIFRRLGGYQSEERKLNFLNLLQSRVNQNNTQDWNKQGCELRDSGHFEEAIACFDKAIQVNSNDAAPHYNKGNAQNDLGYLELAIASYDQALKINPSMVEAWSNRGNVLDSLNKPREALVSYNQALKIQSYYFPACFNRGNVLRDLGYLEDAIASYNLAIRINPNIAAVWHNRGNILNRQDRLRDLEESVNSFDRALELEPNTVSTWVCRGNALSNMGRIEEAISSYDCAIQINENDPEAWYNRGNVLADARRLDEAVKNYTQAIRLQSNRYDAWVNRGSVLLELFRFEEALSNFDHALKINPSDYIAWFNKGQALASLGRYEDAISSFDRTLQINSSFLIAGQLKEMSIENLERSKRDHS
jgi:tetratricopeptide (TPR) repeat protein